MKTEAKVGLFVFIGLVALFLLSTQVNSFVTFGKKGYPLYATVTTVLGLDKNAKVKMNGIDVGYIEDMTLDGRHAKIKMFIYEGAQIPEDCIVELAQDSMLGSKFVNLTPGQSEKIATAGTTINNERLNSSFDQTSTSINAAALELKAFIAELRGTLDPKARADLQAAIANFKVMAANLAMAGSKFGAMSDRFSTTAGTVNERLPAIMAQIDSLSKEFDTTGKTINHKLPTIMDKFSNLEDNLTILVAENRKPLGSAITSIDDFFKAGQPAMGKVDNFFTDGTQTVKKINKYIDKLTQSELQLGLGTMYMAKDGYSQSNLNLAYLPNPTRYYMIGVTSKDDYSKLDGNGQVILPQKHQKSQTLVSAQFGKRFGDTVVRGGLIEGTGGVGVDHFSFNDKLKTSLEVFDFGAKNDVRTTKPHARAQVRYQMLKHFDLYGGIDHFADSKTTNAYVGAGISFVDDDLKYLLGGAGSFMR